MCFSKDDPVSSDSEEEEDTRKQVNVVSTQQSPLHHGDDHPTCCVRTNCGQHQLAEPLSTLVNIRQYFYMRLIYIHTYIHPLQLFYANSLLAGLCVEICVIYVMLILALSITCI